MDLGAEAARLGIEVDYVDAYGRRQVVAPAVLQQIVAALGPAAAQTGATGGDAVAQPVRAAFQAAGRSFTASVPSIS